MIRFGYKNTTLILICAFHCGETVSFARSCIDSMKDLKLFGVQVDLLDSMEVMDMLETRFDRLLN